MIGQFKKNRCKSLKRLFLMIIAYMFVVGVVEAQEVNVISGVVTDSSGEAIPGVSVVESGTTNGTITTIEGDYSLKVASADSKITFSFIGLATQEITLAGRSDINVIMKEGAHSLDEVVAIGYGSVKKADLTGAVASVKSELLENKPLSSFDKGLQGQLAGVSVRQTDGQPGGGASIRIRGTTSINGTNEPLYVIDGMPMMRENVSEGTGLVMNPLSSINPNDIASIDVLKDASATAIYGARGANGVILVTTKKGKEGKGEIKFDAYTSVSSVNETFDLLNGQELAQLGKEAYENSNVTVPTYFSDPESVVTQTNWVDEIFRQAVTQSYQLSFSGAKKDTKYNFSLGYFDQEGVLLNTEFNRYTFRGQVETKVNDFIKIGSSVNYSRIQSDGYGNSSELSLITMAHDMNPSLAIRDADGAYTYRNDLSSSKGNFGGNPIATAYETDMQNRQNRFFGNIFAEFDLYQDKLKFKSLIGVDDVYTLDRFYFPTDLVISSDGPGKGRTSSIDTQSWLIENTLTYSDTFQDSHSITALLGQTAQKLSQNVFRLGVKDFDSDRLGFHDLSAGKNVWLNQTTDMEWQMLSYIARFQYSYESKYLLTFTGRADGSSKFGANNKYGFFPSAAAAWRVSEESFLTDVEALSNLKLRASYGVVGNEGIQPYQSQGTLVNVSVPFGSGVNGGGLGPKTLPNADLGWESTAQFDFGVDVGFFNNRLSFVADFYNKYTSDLLYNVNIPYYSGYKQSMMNLGDISNKGIELAISGVPIQGRFNWSTNFNISSNVTKIEKLNIADGETAGTGWNRMVVGDELGNIWGYEIAGIAQINEDLTQVSQWASTPMVAGDQKYVDHKKDGVLDIYDEVVIGNINPDFSFGFMNNFSYKNWSMNVYVEGTYGNEVINFTRKSLETLDGTRNNLATTLDRWTPDNTDGSLPRAAYVSSSSAFSNRWVEDGSYIRLKDVTVSYAIPRSAFNDILGVNVFVSAENLITLTNYSGYDPSIGAGIDSNPYPTSRVFTGGVSLKF